MPQTVYFHPDLLDRQPKAHRPTHPFGGKRHHEEWEAWFLAVGSPYLTLKDTCRTPKLC